MSKTKEKKQKKLSNSAAQIKSIIDRTEKLLEEKADIQGDISEIMAEAKGNGFDTVTIRRIIRERAQDKAKRAEREAVYLTYAQALGHDGYDDEA